MQVLKNILAESKEYYLEAQKKIAKQIKLLPSGSVKERLISGHKYYYLQSRVGQNIIHKYLGKERPADLLKQIKEKKSLQEELKKVKDALAIIRRSEGRKRD